jgi:hypothetical protein
LHFDGDTAAVGVVDPDGKPRLLLYRAGMPPTVWEGVGLDNASKEGRVSPEPFAYRDLMGRWPVEDRAHFVRGPEVATFRATAQAIRDSLRDHLDLTRREHASLLTAWIIGTYFMPLFLTYPRLSLLGERGSGKSKALQLLKALAFNALHLLAPTGAVLFRLIEPLRPTLCLDEMENMDRESRRAVGAIFNAGYKRGVGVPRTEEHNGRHVVVGYDVYAPLAVASIRGLTDVQADRAITLVMAKGRDRAKVNREVNPDDVTYGRLRGALYRLALTRHTDIRARWETLKTPEWLMGRHRELYKPLLTVAALIEDEGDATFMDDILRLAASESDERGAPSREVEALADFLGQQLGSAESMTFRPGVLAGYLKQVLDAPDYSAEQAGNLLKRCGFERWRDKSGTVYRVSRAEFIEWTRRDGLEMPASPENREPAEVTAEMLEALFSEPIDHEAVASRLHELDSLSDAELLAMARDDEAA